MTSRDRRPIRATTRDLYHLQTIHSSLDSDDDFGSGCWNVSQCHHKQFFSVRTLTRTIVIYRPMSFPCALKSSDSTKYYRLYFHNLWMHKSIALQMPDRTLDFASTENMIREIMDHWSWSGSLKRVSPLVKWWGKKNKAFNILNIMAGNGELTSTTCYNPSRFKRDQPLRGRQHPITWLKREAKNKWGILTWSLFILNERFLKRQIAAYLTRHSECLNNLMITGIPWSSLLHE